MHCAVVLREIHKNHDASCVCAAPTVTCDAMLMNEIYKFAMKYKDLQNCEPPLQHTKKSVPLKQCSAVSKGCKLDKLQGGDTRGTRGSRNMGGSSNKHGGGGEGVELPLLEGQVRE